MRTPFFNSPDRIMRLNLAAAKWRNTPWCANSMAAGVGVSCHNLPRALYAEAHFAELPQIFSTPHECMAANRMETWLDARPEFQRLPIANGFPKPAADGFPVCRNALSREAGRLPIGLQAGDLLGLFLPMDNVGKRIRKPVINHLGVLLQDNFFVHTLMKKHTDFDLINIPPWSQTLVGAWRPVE